MTDGDKEGPGTVAELRAMLDKVTPGPWESRPSIEGFCVESDAGQHVACYCFNDHERHDADAALIAALRNAAPDLLRVVEAARAMITVCQYPCGDPGKCGNCSALREALDRLTGGVR